MIRYRVLIDDAIRSGRDLGQVESEGCSKTSGRRSDLQRPD